MLKEIHNPVIEHARNVSSHGILDSLRMVDRLTKNLKDSVPSRWEKLGFPGEPPIPNGYDFLAYFKPREAEDKDNLLLAGSGMTQADFHRLMLTLGWRSSYLNGFLQTKEINKNPSPQKILSRLKDYEISMVATSNTHLLFSGSEKSLVVFMGLDYIDENNQHIHDSMPNGALALGMLEFLPEDFVVNQISLRPGIIDPFDFFAISQTPHAKEIYDQFPGGKVFGFTPQAKKVMALLPDSEVCLPKHYVNDKAKNHTPMLVSEAESYLTNSFKNMGWEVLV